MTKPMTAYFGCFLIAMQFLLLVHAQNPTKFPGGNAATTKASGRTSNASTMAEAVTKNITNTKGACAALQSSAITVLIPLAATGLLGRF
ncbi:hypothetical protein UPYG_G00225210 [Umbra pygmaea]|uniref:Uncharacterized protein n=1 Tax=Umbra pygmaea TaxID=75934 RepID=A0ABD0WYF8_UMBPY